MQITRQVYDSYEGTLERRIAAYAQALRDHAFTVNVAAPVETDLIEEIVRSGGFFEIEPDPIQQDPAETVGSVTIPMLRDLLAAAFGAERADELIAATINGE